MELILSTKDVAEFFGVTSKTIAQWRKAGCPQVKRGQWDLKQVHEWWFENIAADRAAARSGDESLTEAKRRYWWQKAQAEETKNRLQSGELVEAELINRQGYEAGKAIKDQLSAIPDRVAPLVAAESDIFQCKQLMIKEIDYVLEGIADKLKAKQGEYNE